LSPSDLPPLSLHDALPIWMPAAHGLKDLDDLILTLVLNPGFWKKVNDIEIECGYSLYQNLLDGYTSGADVPFREVQKAWRNTTRSEEHTSELQSRGHLVCR